MVRQDLDNRLRELGIYSDFYYRKELKALTQVLGEYERLNCLLTGVHEGNRKLVAVTDRRILILFTALGGGDMKMIRRESVKEWRFDKKLLFHTLTQDKSRFRAQKLVLATNTPLLPFGR